MASSSVTSCQHCGQTYTTTFEWHYQNSCRLHCPQCHLEMKPNELQYHLNGHELEDCRTPSPVTISQPFVCGVCKCMIIGTEGHQSSCWYLKDSPHFRKLKLSRVFELN